MPLFQSFYLETIIDGCVSRKSKNKIRVGWVDRVLTQVFGSCSVYSFNKFSSAFIFSVNVPVKITGSCCAIAVLKTIKAGNTAIIFFIRKFHFSLLNCSVCSINFLNSGFEGRRCIHRYNFTLAIKDQETGNAFNFIIFLNGFGVV